MKKLESLIRSREKELREWAKKQEHRQTEIKPKVDFTNTSFLERVREYAYNDRGNKIILKNWHKEYYNLISNMAVAETYTSGGSQLGKTLPHYLLVTDLIAQGYNTIWAYDQERNLNRCVPLQFRPIAEVYLNALGISQGKGRSQNNTLFQTSQGSAIFTYTSTTKSSNSTKGAAAGSSVVSFTADILFIEERSQHTIGSTDPLYRRLDAGSIPTHPVRQLGTPGNGNGIEAEIYKADYKFYPAIVCPNCYEEIFLDPKGCLLKPIIETTVGGENKISYLSANGKPNNNWYRHDENDPVNSAYFACPECEHPIDNETRIESSFFKCRDTGILLAEFNSRSFESDNRLKVGIVLSPLLNPSTGFNLASDIIDSGLDTTNPDDWQQQRLGHPSVSSEGNISLEMIRSCISASSDFDRKPDFILAGIDQGRSSHWMMIIEYYVPRGKYQYFSKNQKIDYSYRNVIFARDVNVNEIPTLLTDYKVDYGVIDNEPDRDSTSRLCEATVLEMADQKGNTLKDMEKTEVLHGGVKYPCWKVNNLKFLRRVLNCFTLLDSEDKPITRLPDDWDIWLNNNSESSPIRHLRSPQFNAVTNKWERTDHIDDLFYAFMFAEVAFSNKVGSSSTFWENSVL